jgi:hypothetical protein
MEAATQGRTDGVAAKIITGLKAGVVLALDFLAKQLGLDKIVNSVQGIIKSLRRPIVGAIEWVLGKAKPFVQGLVAAVGKATAKVTSAAKAVFSWAFARAGFRDASGAQHSIYLQGDDNPRLMIASDPRSAEEFVHWYVGSKPKQFADDNARQISVILGLIENAKSIAREIVGLKKNGAAWKDRQRALLDANVALGRELARLVDDDATLGKQVEKYKLEGMTGTYGSMPKPSGDDFTADHQPQAAILIAASRFKYFSKAGELAERAETRAKAGYSINLYKKRHEAGRTYGMKGKQTKEDFIAEVKPRVRDLPAAEQRAEVIRLMKAAMRRDAAAIKSVVRAKYDSPIWDDVRAAAGNKKTQELVGEIRARINGGEDQILNQDLDSLTG